MADETPIDVPVQSELVGSSIQQLCGGCGAGIGPLVILPIVDGKEQEIPFPPATHCPFCGWTDSLGAFLVKKRPGRTRDGRFWPRRHPARLRKHTS